MLRPSLARQHHYRIWPMLCLFLTCLHAQPPAERNDIHRTLAAIKAEATEHPSSFRFLKELSDQIGPRLTGSPQDARAGEWALQTMRAIGLQNVHAEPWQLEKGWRRRHARGQLISPFPLDLIVTSYGWAGSTQTPNIDAGVVQVDGDALADEARKNAASWAGRVLLVAPKGLKPPDATEANSFPEFLSAAIAARAVAVICRDPRPGAALTHIAPVSFPVHASQMAVLDIAKEHEELILRLLQSEARPRLKIDVQNEFTPGRVLSNNIAGEIVGSRYPDEIVILGAHLDSWDLGTGAIDDGFGVAAVLGAAKSIIASGVKPHRTIRFVLFTGEEQGLLGSRAYTKAHQAEIKNFVCALILDWGNGPITKFPVAGHIELREPLEEFARSIGDIASVQIANGFLTYTDAYAFTLAGVPAIAPLQDSANYSLWGHSAADTLDKVSPEVLAKDSALLALAGIWIANYPARIGSVWPPEKTAQALEEQRISLQRMGLWPFS